MNGLKRFLKALLILSVFGASAITLTFYVVSQTDELADDRLRMSSVQAPPPEAFGPRYARWLSTVIGSGLTDFGQSHTGPVKNILADRLPVTAAIGLTSWVLGWGLGLILAILLGTRWRDHARLHQQSIYPISQAIPSLVVVILFYLVLVQIDPRPSRLLRTGVGILSLVVLMLPATTSLWLNGILRILDREYVRVARARGVSPFALWSKHILPNVIVSSGVLTQAVFSLAGLVVGSAFVEGVFRLGGVAEAFIEGATRGQAELTGFATLVYFLVTAAGVLFAEGVVIYLDPDGDLSREGSLRTGFGILLFLLIVLTATIVIAPTFVRRMPSSRADGFLPPTWYQPNRDGGWYLLGTDYLGRPFELVLCQAMSATLTIALLGTISVLLGCLIVGTVHGSIRSRGLEALVAAGNLGVMAVPEAAVLITLATAWPRTSPSFSVNASMVAVLVAFAVPTGARLIAERVRSTNRAGFVEASRAYGASFGYTFYHDVWPHLREDVAWIVASVLPRFVAIEVGLAYLGVEYRDFEGLGKVLSKSFNNLNVGTAVFQLLTTILVVLWVALLPQIALRLLGVRASREVVL